MSSLEALCTRLRDHPNVAEKLHIARAYSPALEVAGSIPIGDDTAAIPDGQGYLLFAAEGMMESFIQQDPWFAGYCAVMVNLSDVAAMGGRPIAVVDVLWAHHESAMAAEIWAGMRAASEAYGVPIVGGHTTRFPVERPPLLAAAVLGRARKLITSFDAKPGHELLMVVDLRASYRGRGTPFWNASVGSPPKRLRDDLEILPKIAEDGLVTAGKDISNGGVLGTLAMLLATSRCGAVVNLDALPRPSEVELDHWLLSFPSYGYLLSAEPDKARRVQSRFRKHGLACEIMGVIQPGSDLVLASQGGRCVFASVAPAVSAPAATSP